jgi:hypothetical protein
MGYIIMGLWNLIVGRNMNMVKMVFETNSVPQKVTFALFPSALLP